MSSDPKYGPTHQALRKTWADRIESGDVDCVEPVCLMPARRITSGSKWQLAHDHTGTSILGPAHQRCHASESTRRNNERRTQRFLAL